jgi:hypothetical protein
MKIVFISGPYRGDVNANIEHAKQAAIRLWQVGYAVICPHLNTAHFDGLCDDAVWLVGDLEILSRCDIIYMLRGWENSSGARDEFQKAILLNIPILQEENGD